MPGAGRTRAGGHPDGRVLVAARLSAQAGHRVGDGEGHVVATEVAGVEDSGAHSFAEGLAHVGLPGGAEPTNVQCTRSRLRSIGSRIGDVSWSVSGLDVQYMNHVRAWLPRPRRTEGSGQLCTTRPSARVGCSGFE